MLQTDSPCNPCGHPVPNFPQIRSRLAWLMDQTPFPSSRKDAGALWLLYHVLHLSHVPCWIQTFLRALWPLSADFHSLHAWVLMDHQTLKGFNDPFSIRICWSYAFALQCRQWVHWTAGHLASFPMFHGAVFNS